MSDVRWGFLGAGWLASRATAAAVHGATGARLEAAAARDLRRAEGLQPRRAYDSYAAVLDDPDVDAVYISLANDAHLPWILAAAEAGKHVLCEKPMVLTADQARQAFEAADSAGVLLVEAVWSRWHPRIQRIVDLGTRGDLGALESYLGSFTFTGDLTGNYRLRPDAGGGALYDIGIYPLHVLLAVLSSDQDLEVTEVARDSGGQEVDMTTRVSLSWLSGRGSVIASFAMPESQRLVLNGSLGRVRVDDDQAFTSWRQPSTLRVDDHVEQFPAVDAYQVMFEQVSARIRGEDAWVVPPSASMRVAEAVDAIRLTSGSTSSG